MRLLIEVISWMFVVFFLLLIGFFVGERYAIKSYYLNLNIAEGECQVEVPSITKGEIHSYTGRFIVGKKIPTLQKF